MKQAQWQNEYKTQKIAWHRYPIIINFKKYKIFSEHYFWISLSPKVVQPCFHLKTYCIVNNDKYIPDKAGWSFFSQSSRHHKLQTVRARERTFWADVHPLPCVTCHMSGVTSKVLCVRCQVSGACVMCHVLGVFNKLVELVAGWSVINGGLPGLVS